MSEFRGRFPGLLEACAAEWGYRPEELDAGGRLPSTGLSFARAVALWVAYEHCGASQPELAAMMGMNRLSVRARVNAVRHWLKSTAGLRDRVATILDGLSGQLPGIVPRRDLTAEP